MLYTIIKSIHPFTAPPWVSGSHQPLATVIYVRGEERRKTDCNWYSTYCTQRIKRTVVMTHHQFPNLAVRLLMMRKTLGVVCLMWGGGNQKSYWKRTVIRLYKNKPTTIPNEICEREDVATRAASKNLTHVIISWSRRLAHRVIISACGTTDKTLRHSRVE